MSTLAHLITTHLLALVGFVMGMLLVGKLLAERRPAGSTIAWLLAIILLPYVGVPLYLVFGGRKLRRKAAGKGRLYDDGPPARAANRLELLSTGEQAFTALGEVMASAERTLWVSTLILGDDEVGEAVVAQLEAKARAGVQVRLLLDALFGLRANARALKRLRAAGARVEQFMPLAAPWKGSANLRLHRKIVVADGRTAIVGGMNLAREYMGPQPFPGRWRDLNARVSGPAVADIAAVFAADWRFAAGEELTVEPAPPLGRGAGAELQVVASGPDVESDRIYDAFLTAVFAAQTRLWIATPYFVPDDGLARALLLAVRRGVDVRIVVPARSNHLTADLAGAGYLRELEAADARVCAYRPGMMHAKVIIVDDRLAALGSANLDMRSLFLDYEIALFTSSSDELAMLAAWFESLLPDCGTLPPASRIRQMAEEVARLLGPLV